MVEDLLNIFLEHDLYLNPNDFWHKIYNFDTMCCWLLLQNIPVSTYDWFVLQIIYSLKI